MLLREVLSTLDAELICGEDLLETEVHAACGSDMMSDVLAGYKNGGYDGYGLCRVCSRQKTGRNHY